MNKGIYKWTLKIHSIADSLAHIGICRDFECQNESFVWCERDKPKYMKVISIDEIESGYLIVTLIEDILNEIQSNADKSIKIVKIASNFFINKQLNGNEWREEVADISDYSVDHITNHARITYCHR